MSSPKKKYLSTLSLQVRDYECDMEGIVNNAVYQNYLEHARHQFLRHIGVSFTELVRSGIHPVVVRSELDYKQPLKSGDEFWIGTRLERPTRLKLLFEQDIFRNARDQEHPEVLAVHARITTAAIGADGRPLPPEKMHPSMEAILRELAS